MKKALKELIETAEEKMVGEFRAFLTIPNGIYDGFCGKNGYDKILLLGRSTEDDRWYKIADSIDAIHLFYPPSLNWEIDSKYGVPSFWTNNPIEIYYDGMTSSILACTDVRINVHASWIKMKVSKKHAYFACSRCGHRSRDETPYCSYCGAQMDIEITGNAGEKEKRHEEQQGKSRSEEGSGDPEA